jgi:DNA-binding MarR family transcriptional regulator
MSSEIETWDVMGALWQVLTSAHAEAAESLALVNLDQRGFYVLHCLETMHTPSELVACTKYPAATITDIVKRLESLGYVERKIDLGDLRRHRLEVTAEGKKAKKHAGRAIAKRFEEKLEHLPKADRATFAKLAIRLSQG